MSNKGKLSAILTLFLVLTFPRVHAQETVTDSLLKVVQTAQEDSNKVNTLNKLAKAVISTTGEFDKAIEYAQQAIDLSQKINFKKGEALARNLVGVCYMIQGDYDKALEFYNSSLKVKEEIGDKKGIAGSYSNMGLVYMYKGEYPKALSNFESALSMETELNDKAGMAGSYNNIGIVYEDLGNYPEALSNYKKSYELKMEVGDKKGMANTVSNVGVIEEIQGNYRKALLYHYAALKIRKELGDQREIADCYNNIGNAYKDLERYPDALKSQLTSLKIYDEIGNRSGSANANNNIGQIYAAQGDSAMKKGNIDYATDRYREALKSYMISLKIRQEIGDQTGVAASLHNIGTVSMKLENFTDAEKYLKEALSASMLIGYKKIIRDSYKELSALDSIQGNMGGAFENYKLFISYRDSLINKENGEKQFAMQMQFQIEQDKKDAAIKAEREKKELLRKNTIQYLVIFLIVFLVVVAVLSLGRIKVPVNLARGLNFVSLLLVFESILVFTDPYLDIFAQGAPYKKLLINIVIAMLIFPLHNMVEKRFRKRLQLK